jgi:class 3 adenylate cyclase
MVRTDFERRRGSIVHKESMQASGALETKALGHPLFEDLAVGEQRVGSMVTVFLDLTDFTSRTFWDDAGETVDLAHSVLSGFIKTISQFGGYPLGLRGDGLFAGFSPGDEQVTAALSLAACAFALDAVENEVNPWLRSHGREPVQARAGLDYGSITFVRTGSAQSSEINPSGFAANFAAKCEKRANSWEVVAGEGLRNLVPENRHFREHQHSPKTYQRNFQRRTYRFYDYRWRSLVPLLPEFVNDLTGAPASAFEIH